MLTVFCRDCGKKLPDVTDVNEDRQSKCPYCGSTFKFYHMISMPAKGAYGLRTHTVRAIQNKYNKV